MGLKIIELFLLSIISSTNASVGEGQDKLSKEQFLKERFSKE